jgi:hypothetical protein
MLMSKAYKSEPIPPASGPQLCFSPSTKVAQSNSLAPLAPTSQARHLAAACSPASARYFAPHQPRAGLRPLVGLRPPTGCFAAARCLAPLLWPLPRSRRVGAPFGPRRALSPAHSSCLVASLTALTTCAGAPRLWLRFGLSARQRWGRYGLRHPAPRSPAPPLPRSARIGLTAASQGIPWGSAPDPAPRRRGGSGGTIRKRVLTRRGCDVDPFSFAWYPGGISALPDGVKFKSALLTQASGSIGGMTASRNRGGLFLRSRVIPVNPNTERQGEARANMATAVGLWSNTLTDSDRQAWTTYANGTPVVDKLGDQLILSGQQMFVKCALPRLVAGLAPVTAGPITAGLATTPDVTTGPAWDVSTGVSASITVPGAATSGDLNVYVSEPTSPSRTVAHAKRAWAAIEGPPVASVFTVAIAIADVPYTGVTGAQARITFVYLSDDGRVSAEVFRDVIITGA